ncbi:B12-binding domain-containing radical SAM protein [Ramlibacter agri]|uniref:B12-binding domain-containing radical SAM protein n=1 Tax=Ramlibacter agri TaxID=2728837 RepID=UPI00197D6EA5|nr:radical SAM protein [Ramlibacter agri]
MNNVSSIRAPRRHLRICLLNPTHTAIGSRIPSDHLPPLGLLAVGGPLLDDGFAVRLVDADRAGLDARQTLVAVLAEPVDVVMMGHSGSSSAHRTVLNLALRLKRLHPRLIIVCGGVHPTYHWQETLAQCKAIDFVVRGEGERTTRDLLRLLDAGADWRQLPGIAWREADGPAASAKATMLECLDDWRVGWELIAHENYSYWGGMRAVVVQFSRGCPYLCSYCGQRGFWTRWRHRDPARFAAELARLHREHGVQLINFADELPTGSRKAWRAFLEALIAQNVPLTLVGSTRAGDIVRDADILHLYKRAGVIRFLLGIESYSQATLAAIRKGATQSEDREAIRLLRQHGILSMASCVVGFDERSDADFLRTLRHLRDYDPDQIQTLYATPHRWTPFYGEVARRRVLEPDTRKWDYKHQVLETPGVPAWRVFAWVKFIEVAVQLRPKALWRTFFNRDPDQAHAMRWYTAIGRKVWFHELAEFLFRRRHFQAPPALEDLAGSSMADEEESMAVGRARGRVVRLVAQR